MIGVGSPQFIYNYSIVSFQKNIVMTWWTSVRTDVNMAFSWFFIHILPCINVAEENFCLQSWFQIGLPWKQLQLTSEARWCDLAFISADKSKSVPFNHILLPKRDMIFMHWAKDCELVCMLKESLTDAAFCFLDPFDSYDVNSVKFYDFIYIFMPFELILDARLCTKHASWSRLLVECGSWPAKQFPLHIFYLVLCSLVY